MANTHKESIAKQSADFRFKQFSICHDKCAMKVSTDGILLGAWAKLNNETNAVDIGTGTGLIALMLAQRLDSIKPDKDINARDIVAVDIDESAVEQAESNFEQSPWQQLLTAHQSDIAYFAENEKQKHRYSTIVSNPPYFSEALQGQSNQRNMARHNEYLPFSTLLKSAKTLATETAVFSLILPVKESHELLDICERFGWYLTDCTKVSSVQGKPSNRYLMAFSLNKIKQQDDVMKTANEMFIRDKENTYSHAFTQLCKDFYLKF